ncbi:MAG: hypothetical protein ABI959_07045 [Candidatus Dormiibacterota bacterium]
MQTALEACLIRRWLTDRSPLNRQRFAFIAVVTGLALASIVASVARPLVCPVGEGCPPAGFASGLPPPLAVGALWALAMALAFATRRLSETGGRAVLVPLPAKALVAAALGVGIALVAAHVFLLSPLESKLPCATPVHLGAGLGYPFNCDSTEFVRDAAKPSRLLTSHNIRQSRPLEIVVATGVSRIVGRTLFATPLPRLYQMATRENVAYVLLNLTIAAVAIALLLRLVPFRQVPVAAVATAVWLAFDDVMKAFVWTPHSQIFNLLVPLVAIAVARAVLVDPRLRRPLALAGIGLGLGTLALAYGSFLVAGGATGIALLLAARHQQAATLTAAGAAALAVGFAVPNVLWIGLCIAVTGSFYSSETTKYWEFVWVLKTAAQGLSQLAGYWWSMTVLTLWATLPTVGPVAIATMLAWLAAIATGTRVATAQVATMAASLLVLGLSVIFLELLGYYQSRLSYMLVPILMVMLVGLVAAVKDRRRHLGKALEGLIVLAAVVNALVLVLRHGPYS